MSDAFGSELRRLRLGHGWSLRELAKMINYSAAYLSEIERGKRPTPQVARRCDDAFGGGGTLTALADDGAPRHGRPVGCAAPADEYVAAAQESARFIRRAAAGATDALVEQFTDEVGGLAVAYLVQPPEVVFAPVAALRREILTALDRPVRPAHTRDLHLLAGRLSALLAQASVDLGHPDLAQSHARAAWTCAELAGNNPLRALVHWVSSHVAHWNGRPVQAAKLARDGRRYATQGSSLLRLASQEARAWAAAADTSAATAALRTAQEAEALLAGEERPCPELLAAARLGLVAGYLAAGDLDAVADRLPAVLDLPPQRRTVPLVGRMSKLATVLAGEPYRGSRAAADLAEPMAHFVAHPPGGHGG
jgi:transcriptional regulator with XRE-family HTH domain